MERLCRCLGSCVCVLQVAVVTAPPSLSMFRLLTLPCAAGAANRLCCTSLCVQQLRIGDDAAALLAQRLTGLAELELGGNNLGPAGAAAVAKHLTRLRRLDISNNRCALQQQLFLQHQARCNCSACHRLLQRRLAFTCL